MIYYGKQASIVFQAEILLLTYATILSSKGAAQTIAQKAYLPPPLFTKDIDRPEDEINSGRYVKLASKSRTRLTRYQCNHFGDQIAKIKPCAGLARYS